MFKFLKISVLITLLAFLIGGQSLFGQVDARLLRFPDVSETQITFIYAGDIWIAPKAGGTAHRLSSPKGEEQFPRFSPDGKYIAFSGNYEGNTDVYVLPVEGGVPFRVTHHPSRDRLLDWYPDGKSLLFASKIESYMSNFNQLYKTSVKGGFPQKLPVAYGEIGTVSADGKFLAFQTKLNDLSTWKRYRGGRASDIYLFDLAKKTSINITKNDVIDSMPMWHGSTLYFISDRGPEIRMNIWAYDTKSKKSRQVTHFKDYDIRFPAIGPKDIIFEKGGALHLMALANEKVKEVKIKVVTDKSTLTPRLEKVSRLIRFQGISPNGKRALFGARGDVFTVPAEHGIIRNLTRSSGTAERFPTWSPDGKLIAYWSDASGEYELYTRPADGSGKATKLTNMGKGFRYVPQWSPDSKKILFVDKVKGISIYDRASKKITVIDTFTWEGHYGFRYFTANWSADSRWITYAKIIKNQNNAVFIYDTQQGKLHQVTKGFYNGFAPVFDPDGKYLYYLSGRSLRPNYSDIENTWIYINTTRIAALTLRKDVPSPFIPENDKEEITDDKEDSAKKADGKKGKKGKKGKNGKNGKDGAEKGKKKSVKPIKIDFDGLQDRIIILTPKAGNFRNLSAVSGKVIFHRGTRSGAERSKRPIVMFDLKEKKEITVLADADNYILAAGGKNLLIRLRSSYAIIPLKPAQKMKKKLAMDLEMTVDPKAEWRQLFSDAWRYQRDFFYDPGLHGRDWNKLRRQYGKMVEDSVTRWDINFILGELIGEISAGHVYRWGGQTERGLRRRVGLLGVNFQLDQGRYRIKKIIDVSSQNVEVQSPLRMPGIKVKEGDYILAVNGIEIDTKKDPWASFQGMGGKTIILTVNSKPTHQGAWEVVTKALSSDSRLRQLAWVEEARRKVAKASQGRIGYIHVPDTSVNGQTEFVRQYLAQFHKEGLIVDERFNRGGQLADRFVEMMNRPIYHYIHVRDSKDTQFPSITHTGPKAMLMNGWAGSGGDAFPFYFKKAGLGPLIGTRTWGGLVGPVLALPLIDGGAVSAPPARFLSKDGKWIIENVGVEPDILLPNEPGPMAQGRDPQLERAIEEVLKAMKKQPPKPTPRRPAYPKKIRK